MKNRDSFEQLAKVGYELKSSSHKQSNLLSALIDASDGQVNVSADESAVLTNGKVCRIVTDSQNNVITFYTAVNDDVLESHGPYDCSDDDFAEQIIPGVNMNINELMYDINDAMSLNSALGILCDEICLHGEISISDATTIINNCFISDSQTKLDLLSYVSSLGVAIGAQPMLQLLKDLAKSVQDAQIIDTSIFVDTSRAHIQAFVGTVIVGAIVTTVSMALIATANIAAVIIGFIVGAVYNVLITLKDRVDSNTNFQIDYTANAQLFENPVAGLYDDGGSGITTNGLMNEGGLVRYTSLPGLAIYQWDGNFNIFLTADCDPIGTTTGNRSSWPDKYIPIDVSFEKQESVLGSTKSIYMISLSNISYYSDSEQFNDKTFIANSTSNLFYQSEQIQNWQIAFRFATGLLQWFSLVFADTGSEYNMSQFYITVEGSENVAPSNNPVVVNNINAAIYNAALLAVRIQHTATIAECEATGEWIFNNLATFLDTLNAFQLVETNASISNIIPGNEGKTITANPAYSGVGTYKVLGVGEVLSTKADDTDMSIDFRVFCDRINKLQSPINEYSGSFQQPFSVLPVKRAYQYPTYQRGAFDRTLKLAIISAVAAGATVIAGSMLIRRVTSQSMIKSQQKLAAYRDAALADMSSKPKFNAWAVQNTLYNAKATIFGWPRIDMSANIGGSVSLAPVLAAVSTLDDTTSKVQESVEDVSDSINNVSGKVDALQDKVNDLPTFDASEKLDALDESIARVSNLIVK